jgi:hypothetical protein
MADGRWQMADGRWWMVDGGWWMAMANGNGKWQRTSVLQMHARL